MVNMANSKVVEIGADQQLQGKSNFISWLRTFERAAKAKDVWKLLIGEEEIIKTEPQEEDYIIYLGGDIVTQGRTLRSTLTPPNTGDALNNNDHRQPTRHAVSSSGRLPTRSGSEAKERHVMQSTSCFNG
jgi:hypothetical protein